MASPDYPTTCDIFLQTLTIFLSWFFRLAVCCTFQKNRRVIVIICRNTSNIARLPLLLRAREGWGHSKAKDLHHLQDTPQPPQSHHHHLHHLSNSASSSSSSQSPLLWCAHGIPTERIPIGIRSVGKYSGHHHHHCHHCSVPLHEMALAKSPCSFQLYQLTEAFSTRWIHRS